MPPPASYVVKLESGDEMVLPLWALSAKANRASNKLTVLMVRRGRADAVWGCRGADGARRRLPVQGHLARRTISLLPEDGKPSPFVQDFRNQMEEAIAEARAARLHHYKVGAAAAWRIRPLLGVGRHPRPRGGTA